MKNKITSVRIEQTTDNHPDSSYLGEFKDSPRMGWTLKRPTGELMTEHGEILASGIWTNYNRGEYNYITGFQHSGKPGSWGHVRDSAVCSAFLRCRYKANGNEQGLKGNLFELFHVRGWTSAQSREAKIRCLDIVYCCLNAYRLERLYNGDWSYTGVIAKAEYVSENGTVQTVRSGGLWGVESDCGAEYLEQIKREQLGELEKELEAIGFSAHAIKRAFKDCETVTT